jgi:hypothetical protein
MFSFPAGIRHEPIRRRSTRALSLIASAAMCVCADAALPQRASIGVSAVVLPSCRVASANTTADMRGTAGTSGTNGQLVASSCNTSVPAQAYVRETAQADAVPVPPTAQAGAPTARRTVTDARVLQYVLDY